MVYINCRVNSKHHVIAVTFSPNFLLSVKFIHLLDMTDLFKINNLVLGRKAIVTSLCSRLEGQRQTERNQ